MEINWNVVGTAHFCPCVFGFFPASFKCTETNVNKTTASKYTSTHTLLFWAGTWRYFAVEAAIISTKFLLKTFILKSCYNKSTLLICNYIYIHKPGGATCPTTKLLNASHYKITFPVAYNFVKLSCWTAILPGKKKKHLGQIKGGNNNTCIHTHTHTLLYIYFFFWGLNCQLAQACFVK